VKEIFASPSGVVIFLFCRCLSRFDHFLRPFFPFSVRLLQSVLLDGASQFCLAVSFFQTPGSCTLDGVYDDSPLSDVSSLQSVLRTPGGLRLCPPFWGRFRRGTSFIVGFVPAKHSLKRPSSCVRMHKVRRCPFGQSLPCHAFSGLPGRLSYAALPNETFRSDGFGKFFPL